MITKPKLPYLETMVTQACNLSCLGCTNFADLPHKGFIKWSDARVDIQRWAERFEIEDFGLIGGEPLMHPKIEDWILGVRELLPNAQIRFTTNGLLLEKKFHVVKLLHEVGNVVFKISKHLTNNKKIENVIDRILKNYEWSPVTEYGINRLKTSNNFRFYTKQTDVFIKTYKNNYENMMPYNSNPKDSISICCQQFCPLLYNGKIYKCSTSALLEDTLNKVGNPNYELWKPFLVNGLSYDCSSEEILNFANSFGKPENICRMCPSDKDSDSKILHLHNVSRKKYVLQNVS